MEIYELLMAIKRRPLMYVREEKIEFIYYLLAGYCFAMYEHNTETNDNIDCKFVAWFGIWMEKWIKKNKLSDEISIPACWYEYIKKIAKNEKDECKVFYELVDIFFEDYNKKRGDFRWRRS